jgi:hypothetical protein
VRVVLAVDPQRFTDAVDALRRAGLVVEGEYPAVGSITGTVTEDRLQALEAVQGVEAVERERTFRLPPPDAPVQ